MSIMADEDEDVPQLSAHTLNALQEFYAEQDTLNKDLHTSEKVGADPVKHMPHEDWQLSQFWYNEETASILTKEALEAAGPSGRIACLSCPTLYQKLHATKPDTCHAVLLEYDKRFQEMFPSNFVHYDYANPLKLPKDYENQFDLVVADPPFLSEECLTKTAQSIKFLCKEKILLCTGATMEELADELIGCKVCQFIPQHANNLANEFRCYANYKTYYLDSQP